MIDGSALCIASLIRSVKPLQTNEDNRWHSFTISMATLSFKPSQRASQRTGINSRPLASCVESARGRSSLDLSLSFSPAKYPPIEAWRHLMDKHEASTKGLKT